MRALTFLFVRRSLVCTHKEAPSDQPTHEPDLQRDLIRFKLFPIREEEQQVGDHADEGRGQQDEAHQAGAFPHAAHASHSSPVSLVKNCEVNTVGARASRGKSEIQERRVDPG